MFRTPITLDPIQTPITPNSCCISVGSCFADFIGSRLASNKLNSLSNPLGIIFHPIAQFNVLEMAILGEMPAEDTYVKSQGVWYNYLFHSTIYGNERKDVEQLVERKLHHLESQLRKVDFLLLTFGTAIQYNLTSSGQLVANCHKVASPKFRKSLTPVEDVVKAFGKLNQGWSNKPEIIVSVSPIRHLKEGIVNNCASKSILRVVCEQLIEMHENVNYFPGYEIMLDDLRDYRFFEKDMIHPNETARDYIWDLFASNYLDHHSKQLVKQWQQILRNINHRPFRPESNKYQEFIKETLKLIEQLPEHIDASEEIADLKKILQ